MATEATKQVTTASVDRLGISVASSSRNVRSVRAGAIYDQQYLAAGQPVWFHPMPDGHYLALFSHRLKDATIGGVAPTGTFLQASSTVDDAPCWALLNPATGARKAVRTIPSRKPGTRTLTAAVTRGDFLFVLNRYRAPGNTYDNALLQNFRITNRDSIILEDEEFVPGNLSLGLWADRAYIWVFGDNGKGELALARKNWGRIGTNNDPNADRLWKFRGIDGWYSDPQKIVALPGPNDKGIPAAGPCSVGKIRDRFYLAATTLVPGSTGATGATGSTAATPAPAVLLRGVVDQLTAVLNGVINGFLGLGPGTITVVTNLLASANEIVTGTLGVKDAGVTSLVTQLLKAITGTPEVSAGVEQPIPDPAAVLEQVLGAIADIPVVGTLATTAGDFLDGVITTALGLGSTLTSSTPTALLATIIKTLTGIDLTSGSTGGSTGSTGGSTGATGTPDTWHSRFYTTRRVDETWAYADSDPVPLGDEDTYQGGGLYLQPQLALSRGFTQTITTNGVTILDRASHHVQVFTGSAPQTVILPATAKVIGTVINPDGSITVPADDLPKLSIANASVTEGNSGTAVVRFTVTASFSPDTDLTVKYLSTAGTATADEDYVTATGTLTIPGGTTSQQVVVTVNGDTTVEADETFTITLSEPTGCTITTATATGTIVNDDSAGALQGLLEDLQNIVNGIASGAIKIGSAIVSTVSTILEQSVRVITGSVGLIGEAVLGLVDGFLNFVSGGTLDLPGDYATPGEALAGILDLIAGGAGAVGSSIANLGQTLYTSITTVGAAVNTTVVNIFNEIVSGITGIFSLNLAAGAPMLLSETPTTDVANRVEYMSYTIHNQSTSDIVVMASSRDKRIVVPHGIGTVFTPYSLTPTLMSNWSWAFAAGRAPKGRTGFPTVHTVGVSVAGATGATGAATGGSTLQTKWSVFDPAVPATPAPTEKVPATAPSTTAADPNLLKELIKRFTILTNSIGAGALSVSTGLVDTVNDLLLGAVGAMTGATPTDPDGAIKSLTTDLLQNLATTGPTENTALAFENLMRQITGGTGLTGGVVQGTAVPTPLEFVQQVVDAGTDLVENVIEGLSNIFAQIINAITGN